MSVSSAAESRISTAAETRIELELRHRREMLEAKEAERAEKAERKAAEKEAKDKSDNVLLDDDYRERNAIRKSNQFLKSLLQPSPGSRITQRELLTRIQQAKEDLYEGQRMTMGDFHRAIERMGLEYSAARRLPDGKWTEVGYNNVAFR
jgi:hypothetical protein